MTFIWGQFHKKYLSHQSLKKKNSLKITHLTFHSNLPGANELMILKNEKTNYLTHWGPVMHICISKITIIGSDNGLSPGWCQAIIWTNAGILLFGPLVTNFNENSYIFIKENPFENVLASMCKTPIKVFDNKNLLAFDCWAFAIYPDRHRWLWGYPAEFVTALWHFGYRHIHHISVTWTQRSSLLYLWGGMDTCREETST